MGMANSHIISGLKAKQEQIRREIRDLEKKLQASRKDLATITDALRVFGEAQSKAKPEKLFGRGERYRISLDALREAPDGLDTKEITAAIAKAKGLSLNDAELRDMGAPRRHQPSCLRRSRSHSERRDAGWREGVATSLNGNSAEKASMDTLSDVFCYPTW